MAISFVGSRNTSSSGSSNGGNVTLTFTGPGGLLDTSGAQATLLENDLVVVTVVLTSNVDNAVTTSSSGWTQLSEIYSNGSTEDTNLAVFYKVMGAVPDTSFVAVGNGLGNSVTIGTVFAFRNVDTTTPFDVASTTATGTATTVANPAAITPSTAGSWIIIAGGGACPTASVYTVPADLSSTTNHFRSVVQADIWDGVVGMGIKTDWTSGAFDCGVFGGGNEAASGSWAAITMALRPATFPPQNLTATLFTNSQTFGTSVVTSRYTLSPTLFTNGQTFGTPVVTSTYTLSPTLFTNTNQVYPPSVLSRYTLTATKFDNTSTFSTPVVTTRYELTAGLFTNSNTIYVPTVRSVYTVYPSLLVNKTGDAGVGQEFFSPYVDHINPWKASIRFKRGKAYIKGLD